MPKRKNEGSITRYMVLKDGGEIVRFLSFNIAKYLANRENLLTGCHFMIVHSITGEVLCEF